MVETVMPSRVLQPGAARGGPGRSRSTTNVCAGTVLIALLFLSPDSRADMIAMPKGAAPTSSTALLVNAIRGQSPDTRIIDLTGSTSADAALVPREARDRDIVYAIGPDAVVASKGIERRTTLVALNVPNPQRLTTAATYISVYPNLPGIFDFLGAKLKIKSAGLIFSPAQNHEVALRFAAEAARHSIRLQPIPVAVGSVSGPLRAALPSLNAVILLVDPIVFDPRTLREIEDLTRAARIPTIGFLPELPSVGVTVALVPPVEAMAALAARSAQSATPGGNRTIEVTAMDIIVSKKSAEEVGLDPKSIGAQKIR
jgi:hypothetical protein